ncbi:sulfite exporter TauE/SafE family protein [Geoalkalibacter halelectricus]|uniref:Probable membrane transporter protein n=2 Tax=Geoalkalibacter halelectricus TaxID=2847045 RepID=A0ABY5ZHU9_9BACT|nr:sulfite exporter TauE/SafE family protein [Geoalkalibacter halelectricus]MDO3376562.1 sulfite exporter TauE/SafE family protein [Geoalkalibacter halelectricus]UWZ78474.1 sulfite exporter TauE/SafE family protein [Geoalkalibacter halelectricus]
MKKAGFSPAFFVSSAVAFFAKLPDMEFLSPQFIGLFLLVGALAGILAGLFGIGGGVVLVPLFIWAFSIAGFPPDLIVHIAFGTSLAIIIPTAFSAALGHRKRGNVKSPQVIILAAGSLLGAALGAYLATTLSGDVLKALFGLMLLGVGLKLFLFHPRLPPEETGKIPARKLLAVGFIGGGFSAFFGIGGGVITVPLLVIALRQPIHLAVGNSSALIVVSALAGTIFYVLLGFQVPHLPSYCLGYVNVVVATLVAPVSMVCARLGVRLATRIRNDKLMYGFAVFLILIGLRMFFSLWF